MSAWLSIAQAVIIAIIGLVFRYLYMFSANHLQHIADTLELIRNDIRDVRDMTIVLVERVKGKHED